MELTDRQRRERDYHVEHAKRIAETKATISYDLALSPKRRWWNAHWDIYTYLRRREVGPNWRALVVGCGSGYDALQLAKLGLQVDGFDLSPEMLAVAREQARDEGLSIEFREMPAEHLSYPDNSFDLIFVRDILHHVDISAAMAELSRVSKPDALVIIDEIYSHAATDLIRQSWLVRDFLYPRMRDFIYRKKIYYVTEDERKLTEKDVRVIQRFLSNIHYRHYFNFIVTRLIHDKIGILNRLDRLTLVFLGPLGRFVAGRVVFAGHMKKGTA